MGMGLNMFNAFKVYGARLLSFALCFSIAFPLRAQNFPKHLEKEFRQDATLQVTKAVKIYNAARIEFEKKGAQAFSDQLAISAPKAFTLEERTFLSRHVAREQILPVLEVKGDRLIGREGNKEVFNLSTFDVAQGKFAFKNSVLIYQHHKRVIENFEDWKNNKQGASKNSSLLDYIAFKIENLLFPQAHAFTPMTGLLIGLIVGGLVGHFLPKMLGWNKGKEEVSTDTDHTLPQLPQNTATTTPATQTTEEKKEDSKPDSAALPENEKTNPSTQAGADTTTPAGGAASPTTTPPAAATPAPLSEEGKAYVAANAFIEQKFLVPDVSDIDSLRGHQSHADYKKDACKLIQKLLVALTDTAKTKLEKPAGKKVFEALIKNSEGNEIKGFHCSESIEKIKAALGP